MTKRFSCCVWCVLSCLLVCWSGLAKEDRLVRLASTEMVPYIGQHLPQQGFVHELVLAAFEQVGYEVEIQYYPLARAQKYAREGKLDGLVPAYQTPAQAADYVYSSAFPGTEIGLLKQKHLEFSFNPGNNTALTPRLEQLRDYHISLVRGNLIASAFDDAVFLSKQWATNDLQNIDKLAAGRMDFAVIDKFTAADLMVNQRPHLIGQLAFVQPSLLKKDFHIAFSKQAADSVQLRHEFNRGLKKLKQAGEVARIRARHGLFAARETTDDKTRLVIGSVNNADMLTLREQAHQYTRSHPDVRLEWRILDENTLRQRLLSDLAIGDGQFDIVTIGTYEAPIWAKRDWLTPFTRLPADYDLEDVFASVRGALSYQQQLFALPFYAESSMLFYRQDLLRQAGLTMPETPSYADIELMAAALHHPEQGTYGICLRGKPGWGENMALISTMVHTFGGRWFDPDWQPQLDQSPWYDAVDTYIRLLRRYGPPQPYLNGYKENLRLFAKGQCALWIDATSAAGHLFDSNFSKVKDKVAYAPSPTGKTDKGAHWLWSWALAVPTSSAHQKEAQQFIQWATSKSYIEQVAASEGWGAVPPGTRESTYANANYRRSAPYADFVRKAIVNASPKNATVKPVPYTGIQYVDIAEFSAIGRLVGIEIAEALKGHMSVGQALLQSQKEVEWQMRSSGYYD